jgi:hypothetical protein
VPVNVRTRYRRTGGFTGIEGTPDEKLNVDVTPVSHSEEPPDAVVSTRLSVPETIVSRPTTRTKSLEPERTSVVL